MKKISLIGSTGSIGRQVLEVVRRHPDKFKIVGLAAFSKSELFERQVKEFKPAVYAAASVDKEGALAVAECAEADIIFNAAGGFAGLEYSLKGVEAGKTVALANKETLVCGGELIAAEAGYFGAKILPVDSEHSAIWQCLNFTKTRVKRLIITASGGAFRGKSYKELEKVTVSEALNHPTWNMGKKITIDSATLMNKGYEVIEAHILFGTDYNDIETVIQPQSVIHSLVEFDDGACLAQLSYPTMEIPIQLALTYPERLDTAVNKMDFKKAFSLDFQPMNSGEYPCFDLALECGRAGGIMPCVLNAADEVAVSAFLNGRIAFTDIYRIAAETVNGFENKKALSFEQLKDVDALARERAQKLIK